MPTMLWFGHPAWVDRSSSIGTTVQIIVKQCRDADTNGARMRRQPKSYRQWGGCKTTHGVARNLGAHGSILSARQAELAQICQGSLHGIPTRQKQKARPKVEGVQGSFLLSQKSENLVNLVDIVDAYDGRPGIILANVARREGLECKRKWPNAW